MALSERARTDDVNIQRQEHMRLQLVCVTFVSYFQAALAAFLLPVNSVSLAARSLIILLVSWSVTGTDNSERIQVLN